MVANLIITDFDDSILKLYIDPNTPGCILSVVDEDGEEGCIHLEPRDVRALRRVLDQCPTE